MTEFFNQNGIYVLYIGGVIVISIVVMVVLNLNYKKKKEAFLKEHPDAIKVFLSTKALITSEVVTVHLINDLVPVKFMEKGKTGVYLIPGTSRVQMSYTYTRPGIMYKNVTKSTGVIERELEVEKNKNYLLSYDRKVEDFVFEEL